MPGRELRARWGGTAVVPVVLAVLGLAGCSARANRAETAAAPSAASQLAAMHATWNDVAMPAGTGCAQDSTFHIAVHPGDPDKLLVYFNGGGACWRAAECDPSAHPTYTTRVDTANAPGSGGIFDVANAANPISGFTMVFVPYCTGDVHLGSRTVEYVTSGTASRAPHYFSIRHRGGANADAALAWAFSAVPHPSVVVVAGSSAGAVPSPVFAERAARRYPDARVVQLGDAAGGYGTSAVPGVLELWGATDYLRRDPAFSSVAADSLTFEMLYNAAARAAPRVRFAQFNTVEDGTQQYFLSLLGIRDVPLSRFLSADLAAIRQVNPALRTYTAPGRIHTILRGNGVYTTTVDGIAFRDWLAALVAGREVQNVGERLLTP